MLLNETVICFNIIRICVENVWHRKILLIKMVEEIDAMPMLEVADLVKALEEKYGVSAAMPMMAAAPAAALQLLRAAEEKAQV